MTRTQIGIQMESLMHHPRNSGGASEQSLPKEELPEETLMETLMETQHNETMMETAMGPSSQDMI